MRAVDPDVHVTLTKLDEKVEKHLQRNTKATYFIIILNSERHSKYEHGY